MNYVAAGFLSVDAALDFDFDAEIDAHSQVDAHDIGDEAPFESLFEDDCASFDATDMTLDAPLGGVQAALSDDDALEVWFAQQVQQPAIVRARRRRAAVANGYQLVLFA